MKTKDAVKSAVQTALNKGRERLAEFEREHGQLPPPAIRERQAALREHLYGLLVSMDDPDLYSAILQNFLQMHAIPLPRGVFKRNFYEPPTSTVFSPDGTPQPLFGSKIGRPAKADKAWALAVRWLQSGQPSFGKFFVQMYPPGSRAMSPRKKKKGADRIRQQINSVLRPREKSRK